MSTVLSLNWTPGVTHGPPSAYVGSCADRGRTGPLGPVAGPVAGPVTDPVGRAEASWTVRYGSDYARCKEENPPTTSAARPIIWPTHWTTVRGPRPRALARNGE